MAESSWTIAERVARESRGRLVAILARKLGDLHAAEDALADAFAKALDVWPVKGVPEHPEAWLITVAQRGFIDGRRSVAVAEGHVAHLELLAEERDDAARASTEAQVGERTEDAAAAEDPRIALLFVCAHPAIDEHIRTPLMLQAVLGVNADAMAPLWLSKGSTIGQRLVRAKKKISAAAIPFSIPPAHERRERLQSVLDAIYGALTISSGDQSLALEAEYLAALLASAFQDEPEVLGLFALCLFRIALAADESIGPLTERDTDRWDHDRIHRAEAFLKRAARRRTPGRFQLEAAIQSAHITGSMEQRPVNSDIVALYRRLLVCAPTLGAVCGLVAALIFVGELDEARELLQSIREQAGAYQPYWVVQAKLAEAEQDTEKLIMALEIALPLTHDASSHRHLTDWIARIDRKSDQTSTNR